MLKTIIDDHLKKCFETFRLEVEEFGSVITIDGVEVLLQHVPVHDVTLRRILSKVIMPDYVSTTVEFGGKSFMKEYGEKSPNRMPTYYMAMYKGRAIKLHQFDFIESEENILTAFINWLEEFETSRTQHV